MVNIFNYFRYKSEKVGIRIGVTQEGKAVYKIYYVKDDSVPDILLGSDYLSDPIKILKNNKYVFSHYVIQDYNLKAIYHIVEQNGFISRRVFFKLKGDILKAYTKDSEILSFNLKQQKG